MIFKSFVEMYSQSIKASQMNQQINLHKRRTTSGEIKYDQQPVQPGNAQYILTSDMPHISTKVNIIEQRSNSPLNERRVISVERQRNEQPGRNSFSNLQGFGSIKIRGSHSNQLHIQNEQKFDKRFQQVFTANQPFQGNAVGVAAPRFMRADGSGVMVASPP